MRPSFFSRSELLLLSRAASFSMVRSDWSKVKGGAQEGSATEERKWTQERKDKTAGGRREKQANQ